MRPCSAGAAEPGGFGWTGDISHGETIGDGHDQTPAISLCLLRYLYQRKDPNAGGDYNTLPWRLALLRALNR
ncbi:hypothetical protein [Nonomuraea jabiensis]|uniref:hypothetical protein n=1 Tax=Nonomuraea jabiensis TaxID=882448 RepID=UPI003D7351F7